TSEWAAVMAAIRPGRSACSNQNIASVFYSIESAHALDERRYRHPHPTGTRGIHVHDEYGVRLGAIGPERRDMAAPSLVPFLPPVVYDHVIAGVLEVLDEIGTNFRLGLA